MSINNSIIYTGPYDPEQPYLRLYDSIGLHKHKSFAADLHEDPSNNKANQAFKFNPCAQPFETSQDQIDTECQNLNFVHLIVTNAKNALYDKKRIKVKTSPLSTTEIDASTQKKLNEKLLEAARDPCNKKRKIKTLLWQGARWSAKDCYAESAFQILTKKNFFNPVPTILGQYEVITGIPTHRECDRLARFYFGIETTLHNQRTKTENIRFEEVKLLLSAKIFPQDNEEFVPSVNEVLNLMQEKADQEAMIVLLREKMKDASNDVLESYQILERILLEDLKDFITSTISNRNIFEYVETIYNNRFKGANYVN